MLSGEYEHTVDDKGRLIIPAKFRARLAEGLFVTRGLDGCLFIFPPDRWKDLSEKMANLSLVQASARLFSRMIYSGIECKLDKQGRILLPPPCGPTPISRAKWLLPASITVWRSGARSAGKK